MTDQRLDSDTSKIIEGIKQLRRLAYGMQSSESAEVKEIIREHIDGNPLYLNYNTRQGEAE